MTTWQSLTVQDALAAVKSSEEGLTAQNATIRQKEYGSNKLPEPPALHLIFIFLRQFKKLLICLLFVAGLVSIILGEYSDAGFILAILLIHAGMGTLQEWRVSSGATSLHSLLKLKARARRDGHWVEIDAADLVPGDIIALEAGNRIPADTRLCSTHQLQVDESVLTGESTPVTKRSDAVNDDVALADRLSMCYAGAATLAGRGTGVVVGTGLDTEIGRIIEADEEPIKATGDSKLPLMTRLEKSTKQLSIGVLGVILLLAAISLLRDTAWEEVFFISVALAVSAIPEGLPAAITVALSIATSKMAKRKTIVRKLDAVQALGSCTKIVSGKTGTLTINKQTAKIVELPYHRQFNVSGQGYNDLGEITQNLDFALDPANNEQLRLLVESAILCSEGSLYKKAGKWVSNGDAIDLGFMTLGHKLQLDVSHLKDSQEIIREFPYEPDNRFAGLLHRQDGMACLSVKGSLETILPMCDKVQVTEGKRPIDILKIKEQAESLIKQGYRVIAVASGAVSEELEQQDFAEQHVNGLIFLGMVGFVDPLRPDMKSAIQACSQAGVEVSIVTGDHPVTALATAKELGIAVDRSKVTTGRELEEIEMRGTEAFHTKVSESSVFARVTPVQKLQIVDSIRKRDHIVAATGAGIYDVPALEKASIGVAVGSGTDLAKESASIIIADDSFKSIRAGIEEGRYAYDNIRKITYLLISTGAAEIFMFLMALAYYLPIPLLAVQLLWLSLVTKGIQEVALAFEKGERHVMDKLPRPVREDIFNRLMIEQTVVSGIVMGGLGFAAWYWTLAVGFSEYSARNLVLCLIVLLKNVHAFNSRSETKSVFRIPFSSNPLLVGGVVLAQSIHLLVLHSPLMQRVLGVEPVSLFHWVGFVGMALSLLFIMEIYKGIKSWKRG